MIYGENISRLCGLLISQRDSSSADKLSLILSQIYVVHFFVFDEGERSPNLVLGVLCYTGRKIQKKRFSVIVVDVVDAKLAPQEIFAGACARWKLVWLWPHFHAPRPQTVNLACKHNVRVGED